MKKFDRVIKFEDMKEYIKEDEDFIITLGNFSNTNYIKSLLKYNDNVKQYNEEENEINLIFYPSNYKKYLNDDKYLYMILSMDFDEINTDISEYNYKVLFCTSNINNLI